MNTSAEVLQPTSSSERIISLDVLRGVAVLGILMMNIQSFSMISAAYINPAAYGDLTGINKWIWIISHVLADSKFMSIFSMLFGAGAILFTDRAKQKGKKAGLLFYKRMFWLLLFGLVHAYVIWYGDILTSYALCGSLVFLFRKLSSKNLIIIALAFFIIPVALNLMAGATIPSWPQEQYNESVGNWLYPDEKVQEQNAAYQGSWSDQMPVRAEMAFFMQSFLFFWSSGWRIVAMMLLGMVLYKKGILSAKKSNKFYWRLSVIGIGTGVLLSGIGVYYNFRANWHYDFSMFFGSQFNYFGSVSMALGYIGVIMLICKSLIGNYVLNLFSTVGKMAFTNYILMSVVAMFVFYGNGLGIFGQVERWEQILFVIAIWAIILIISPVWLKHYTYGLLEWLWRTLTYWKTPKFKKS